MIARCVSLAIACLLVACSSSGPPRPPDPTTFAVRLTWTAVDADEEGSPVDVERYRLACSQAEPNPLIPGGQEFGVGTTSAVLQLPAGAWRCRVVAIARDGSISDPSNLVSKALP